MNFEALHWKHIPIIRWFQNQLCKSEQTKWKLEKAVAINRYACIQWKVVYTLKDRPITLLTLRTWGILSTNLKHNYNKETFGTTIFVITLAQNIESKEKTRQQPALYYDNKLTNNYSRQHQWQHLDYKVIKLGYLLWRGT